MTILNKLTRMRALLGAIVTACFLGTVVSGSVLAAPQDQDIFDDFESINSTDFTIGTGDDTASFTGGSSGTIGIPELYTSGANAWMVNPGETGQIEFGTTAAMVEFFVHPGVNADGTTVVTAFDDQDVQVGEPTTLNPGDGFRQVSIAGVKRIEITNNSSTGMNAVDDFGFSSAPGLALPVSVNQTSYTTGDDLMLDIGISSPGLTAADMDGAGLPSEVDVYMVIVMPDGDQLAYFQDLDGTLAIGSLSNLAEVTPMIASFNTGDPAITISDFFTYNWTGLETAGEYTAHLVMVNPESLADGQVDLGDIVQIGSTTFSYNP